MKSKPQSAPSKPSTPKRWAGSSQDAHYRVKQPCSAIFLTGLFLLLTACSSPQDSHFEATVPAEAHTVVPAPTGITHTLTLQTPTPAWKLVPFSLYRNHDGTYICIHTLAAPDGMVAQMISSTSNQIKFPHEGESEPVIKHYVLGKTWKWNGNPEVTFIDSLDEIKDALAEAQSVPFTTP